MPKRIGMSLPEEGWEAVYYGASQEKTPTNPNTAEGRMAVALRSPRSDAHAEFLASEAPDLLHVADGFKFPCGKATKAQVRRLRDLAAWYWLRFRLYHDLELGVPMEVLTATYSARETAIYEAKQDIKEWRGAVDEAVWTDLLAVECVRLMTTGELAGVLGYRKTDLALWLFGVVADQIVFRLDAFVLLHRTYDAAEPQYDEFRQRHARLRLDYLKWIGKVRGIREGDK